MKCSVSDKDGSSRGDADRRQRSHYAEGSKGARNGKGPTFVMKHKENSMKASTSKPNEEWFSYLEKPKNQGSWKPVTTPHIPSNMLVKFP